MPPTIDHLVAEALSPHANRIAPVPVAFALATGAARAHGVAVSATGILATAARLDGALIGRPALRELGARGRGIATLLDAVDDALGDRGLARRERVMHDLVARSAPASIETTVPDDTSLGVGLTLPTLLTLALVVEFAPKARLAVDVVASPIGDRVVAELERRSRHAGASIDLRPAPLPLEIDAHRLPTQLDEARWLATAIENTSMAGRRTEVVAAPGDPLADLVIAALGRRGQAVVDERPVLLRDTALWRLARDGLILGTLGSLPGEPRRERRLRRIGPPPANLGDLETWLDEARWTLNAEDLPPEGAEEAAAALLFGAARATRATDPTSSALAVMADLGRIGLERDRQPDAAVRVTATPQDGFEGHRFIVGADAERFPVPISDDPVLPLDRAVRLELSLGPEAAAVAAWYRGAMTLVGARWVTVTMAHTVEAQLTRPSPLLDDLGIEIADRHRQTRPPGPWARRAGVISALRRRATPSPWTWDIGAHHLPRSLSVTQLEEAASCGARFALSTLLRVSEPEPEGRQASSATMGTLAHALLEQDDLVLDAEALFAALTDLVRSHPSPRVRTELTRDPLGVHRLRDLASHLARVLASEDLRPIGEVHREIPFELELCGTRLRARFDRLERQGSTWRVLDYKLRASRPESWPIASSDRPVQLCAYALLAAKGSSPRLPDRQPPTSVTAAWVLLRARDAHVIAPSLPDLAVIDDEICTLIERLDRGQLDLDPGGRGAPCRLCRRRATCGVAWQGEGR